MTRAQLPPRVTPRDSIILDFARGYDNMKCVDCDNPEQMSKTLHRRLVSNNIQGVKVHLFNGRCFLEVEDGKKQSVLDQYKEIGATRERMLQETKDRQKAKIPRYSLRNRINKRRNNIETNVSSVVDKLCYDFSESDRLFLKHEIANKLTENRFRGRAYHVQIAALIYLLSKCPANSGTPLQFRDVYNRYCAIDGHDQIRCFYDAVKDAKEAGIQSCRITCEMVIASKKDALERFAVANEISQEAVRGIMSRAIDFTKLEKIKMEMMGKNPFVVSAASVYRNRLPYTSITQDDIGFIFNVTPVSIRNTIRRFGEILPPEVQ